MKISFSNIEIDRSPSLSCYVVSDELNDKLHINLPYFFVPQDEIIALAYATLCGKKYDVIEFDLSLGEACVTALERFCDAVVICRKGVGRSRKEGQGYGFNFSGGFDSLGALPFMPEPTHLISLDFGGKFSRERPFFERFDPFIFETNLIDFGFNRNHWSFMGIGSILMSDELSLGSVSFGSIMGGATTKIIDEGFDHEKNNLPLFRHIGMRQLSPVIGVTEIGTLYIAASKYPGMIKDSLKSLANPKEGKFFRKSAALKVMSLVIGNEALDVDLPKPRRWYEWGKSYADDMSAIFVAKHLGLSDISDSYKTGIPEDVERLINRISMDFYFKINQEAYKGVVPNDYKRIMKTAIECGLSPYDRKDWDELAMVDRFIRFGKVD